MRQVLFFIPLSALNGNWPDLPIYGYGMMLFLAFFGCTWLASRIARREGIDPRSFPDLVLWLFIFGILGGRLTFVVQEWPKFAAAETVGQMAWQIIALWDGGLVFYGAAFAGALGYYVFWYLVLRREGVTNWKMADVVAPCLALGLALGRVGCLLTGCCHGEVACPDCPAISFPVPNGPNAQLIRQGYEAPFGVALDSRDPALVRAVEPGSGAARAGVKPGDTLVALNGAALDTVPHRGPDGSVSPLPVGPLTGLEHGLLHWPRGQQDVRLTVRHPDGRAEDLPPFQAWSLGVHPTQMYETISMSLLLFFLLSYHPYKRRDGELLVYVMLGYAVHRFLNEMLRSDNEPGPFGLTFSQNVSLGIFAAGVVLGIIVWLRPRPAPVTPFSPGAALGG